MSKSMECIKGEKHEYVPSDKVVNFLSDECIHCGLLKSTIESVDKDFFPPGQPTELAMKITDLILNREANWSQHLEELLAQTLEQRTREIIESIPIMHYHDVSGIANMVQKLKDKYGIK